MSRFVNSSGGKPYDVDLPRIAWIVAKFLPMSIVAKMVKKSSEEIINHEGYGLCTKHTKLPLIGMKAIRHNTDKAIRRIKLKFSYFLFEHPNILPTSDELLWSNSFLGSITHKNCDFICQRLTYIPTLEGTGSISCARYLNRTLGKFPINIIYCTHGS